MLIERNLWHIWLGAMPLKRALILFSPIVTLLKKCLLFASSLSPLPSRLLTVVEKHNKHWAATWQWLEGGLLGGLFFQGFDQLKAIFAETVFFLFHHFGTSNIDNKRPWKTSSFPMKLRQNWWQNVRIDEHFSYYDWNSAKKLQKIIFYFHWTNSQKGLYVWDPNSKTKAQIKKIKTLCYYNLVW